MKNKAPVIPAIIAIVFGASFSLADTTKDGSIDGKKEFEKHCSVCHPNGGNTINAAKTLHKEVLTEHGIKSVNDVVRTMRTPGPGMTSFDESTIPDQEAKAIAGYVLRTFK